MAEVKANSRTAAALYARVSTSDQNCGLQLEELRRYASQRFSSVFEFVDIGVSGTEPRRSQLDALMRGARKRRFDAVLVWKFDRFGRSLKHLLDSLEEFHSHLLAERVRAGIAHARRIGKRIGRPHVPVNAEPIIRLRNEGMSLRKIARKLDIPVSRVRRALARNTSGSEQGVMTPAAPPAGD